MNRLSALFALALLGMACGSPPPPPRRPLPKPPPAKTAEETDASQQQQTMYVYSPIGKRDPFQNVFGATQAETRAPPNRTPTELQKFSLDQLRVAMTVTGTASPMAMVEVVGDSKNRGWPIRVGDFVGKNWGKVTSIQRDKIVVTETITDNQTGRVYPQNITLQVPQTKEEEADLKALQEGDALIQNSQQAQPPGGR
jgi:type IV pilus assembly protein PilP